MPSTLIYLSLGSNIGDRAANLCTAIAALAGTGVCVKKVSSFYETEPVDYKAQPWFLNCVVEAETDLVPLGLLRALRGIETHMGSKKEFAKGPRLIDMDILLYGQQTIDAPELQVPHPRMPFRRFVLEPLAEIAPALKHPSWPATAADLLKTTPDQNEVRRIE